METFSELLALCAGNSPVTGEFPDEGQWCQFFMFSLICAWTNGWVNNRDASDLRRHSAHYVTVMLYHIKQSYSMRAMRTLWSATSSSPHDGVIKWKHFSRYWPFVRGIHWSPVNSPQLWFFLDLRLNSHNITIQKSVIIYLTQMDQIMFVLTPC